MQGSTEGWDGPDGELGALEDRVTEEREGDREAGEGPPPSHGEIEGPKENDAP